MTGSNWLSPPNHTHDSLCLVTKGFRLARALRLYLKKASVRFRTVPIGADPLVVVAFESSASPGPKRGRMRKTASLPSSSQRSVRDKVPQMFRRSQSPCRSCITLDHWMGLVSSGDQTGASEKTIFRRTSLEQYTACVDTTLLQCLSTSFSRVIGGSVGSISDPLSGPGS